MSQLLANPMSLNQLSLAQREALRKAAEQKWLRRNPSFKPYVAADVAPKRPTAQKQRLDANVEVTQVAVSAKAGPSIAKVQSSRRVGSESLLAAQTAEGGLEVPVC